MKEDKPAEESDFDLPDPEKALAEAEVSELMIDTVEKPKHEKKTQERIEKTVISPPKVIYKAGTLLQGILLSSVNSFLSWKNSQFA